MPTSKQAKKRVRQSEKRRLHNRVMRSTLRTQIKKVEKAIEEPIDVTPKNEKA